MVVTKKLRWQYVVVWLVAVVIYSIAEFHIWFHEIFPSTSMLCKVLLIFLNNLFTSVCLPLFFTSRSFKMKKLLIAFVVCCLNLGASVYSFRLLVLPKDIYPPEHLDLKSHEYFTYYLSSRQARQIIETR